MNGISKPGVTLNDSRTQEKMSRASKCQRASSYHKRTEEKLELHSEEFILEDTEEL